MSSSPDEAIRRQVGTLRRPMSVREERITGKLFGVSQSRQHKVSSPQNEEILRRIGPIPDDLIFIKPGCVREETYTDEKFRNLAHYRLKGVVFSEGLNRQLISRMRRALFGSDISDIAQDFPTVMLLLAVQLTVPGTNALIFGDALTTDGDSLPETYLQWTQKAQPDNPDGRARKEVDDITAQKTDYENLSLLEASFISVYMFGLAAKSVDNMLNSRNLMGSRFQGFYRKFMVNMPGSEKIWAMIKTQLASNRVAITTWILIISIYETFYYSNPSFEIVRFLACEPLSYSGMHAYPLLLEVQMKTKRRLEDLITDLWSNQTKAALLQIIEIIQNFEIVQDSSTRNYTFFRYARVASPRFFQKLQTKNCLGLVYCLANILSHYTRFTESNDPRRIVALNVLGPHPRRLFGTLATVIVDAYKQAEREMSDG